MGIRFLNIPEPPNLKLGHPSSRFFTLIDLCKKSKWWQEKA